MTGVQTCALPISSFYVLGWWWEATIPNGERCNHRPHFPESGSTCEGIHSEKIKGRNSKFLFTAQLLRNLDLADIFSDSRSGIAENRSQIRCNSCAVNKNRPFPLFFSFEWIPSRVLPDSGKWGRWLHRSPFGIFASAAAVARIECPKG